MGTLCLQPRHQRSRRPCEDQSGRAEHLGPGSEPIYSVGASLSNVKVGLFAWNGPATTSDPQVSFQHFHIVNGGPGSTPRKSR